MVFDKFYVFFVKSKISDFNYWEIIVIVWLIVFFLFIYIIQPSSRMIFVFYCGIIVYQLSFIELLS